MEALLLGYLGYKGNILRTLLNFHFILEIITNSPFVATVSALKTQSSHNFNFLEETLELLDCTKNHDAITFAIYSISTHFSHFLSCSFIFHHLLRSGLTLTALLASTA